MRFNEVLPLQGSIALAAICLLVGGMPARTIAATPYAPQPDYRSPAAIVGSFYDWYRHAPVLSNTPGMRAFFTPLLANGFAHAQAVEDCTHKEIIDYDPFAGAQVSVESIAVGKTSLRGTQARVAVAVTLWKHLHTTMTVVTVRRDGQWRIDDFIDSRGTSELAERARARSLIAGYRNPNARSRACVARIPY
jgi:hypothetical protein